MTRGFDHVDIVVASLERSFAFYRGLLYPLGWRSAGKIEGERGELVRYLSRRGGGGELGLRERQSDAPHNRYAVGVHHLAFAAPSREAVDERAAWLREQGVELESGPKRYQYERGYYAVFFPDPDGLKLEIVYRPRQRAAASA